MCVSDSDLFPDCTPVLFSPSCMVSSSITLTGRAQLTALCIGPMNVYHRPLRSTKFLAKFSLVFFAWMSVKPEVPLN